MAPKTHATTFRFTGFCFLLLLFISLHPAHAQGFLHASGKTIVNGNGDEVYLQGMGLGGWLVQEGYMFGTSGFANSPSEIRAKIEALVGTSNADQFYTNFRKNFVTRADIQQLATWGFNSVRLPMHYNLLTPKGQIGVYLESGFAIIDSLLQWCKENKIYLILDLHCAPGGQNSANISDYSSAYPSLWQDTTNKQQTIALWKKLAERYVNETWIGGYDLLNETVWDLGTSNQALRDLYIAITNAIRSVDTNHLIFIEGNNWANDFTGLSPAWDNNMAYSFHKYWNENTTSAIQSFLDLRNKTNCPLWLGESGENSNQWFTDCIALMKANDIGWSWWTLKKIESTSGMMNIVKPTEYNTLLKYWSSQTTQPSVSYAVDALNKLNQAVLYSSCIKNNGVIDAMFRQVGNTATIPFAQNTIPGIIYASNYDMGQYNYAYRDIDYQNIGNSVYNSGYQFRNDGVDIEVCSDFPSNGYDVGWINAGESLTFTTNITIGGIYRLNFRVASTSTTGRIIVRCDNNVVGSFVSVPNTGSWTTWQTMGVDGFTLPQGTHQIQLSFLAAGFNLNYVDFALIAASDVKDKAPVKKFALNQNYPNPFNGQTEISFSLPAALPVTLNVYTVTGQKVAELLHGASLSEGEHHIRWDAGSNPSGIYFYTLQAGEKTVSKSMLLLK